MFKVFDTLKANSCLIVVYWTQSNTENTPYSWFCLRMLGGNYLFWASRSGPFPWTPPLFSPFLVRKKRRRILTDEWAAVVLRGHTLFTFIQRAEHWKHGESADEQDHVWDSSASRGGHQIQTDAPWRDRVCLLEMYRDIQSWWVPSMGTVTFTKAPLRKINFLSQSKEQKKFLCAITVVFYQHICNSTAAVLQFPRMAAQN